MFVIYPLYTVCCSLYLLPLFLIDWFGMRPFFRHLSLKIMAAIKHFPCCFSVQRLFPWLSASAHFAIFLLSAFPLVSLFFPTSFLFSLLLSLFCVYQIWFAAISLPFSMCAELFDTLPPLILFAFLAADALAVLSSVSFVSFGR